MTNDYKKYIKEGRGRCDLTDLFLNSEILDSVVNEMTEPFLNQHITKVIALEAMGFVFGSRIAEKLNIGLVLARKEGKLASFKSKSILFKDYSGKEKSFEISEGSLSSNDLVLIVDDWSETGAQLKAIISLVEGIGAKVYGATCFNIDKPVYNDSLLSKYELHSVVNC